MATTFNGSAADDIISLKNFGQPAGSNTYTIDGGGGNDTFYFANGTSSYLSRFPRSNFTINPVNSSGVIVVTGASSGGSNFTLYLTSVEYLVFANNEKVTLSYAPAVDTTPPVFSSAVVNGTSLVLTYTDAANLDASNPPAPGAFSVSNHTVSGVSVNAAAKTVTLTLSSAVAYGESVTVSYTDPTASNDAKAIQDISGNDAASISLKPVTNNTPAPSDTTAPVFSTAVANGTSLVLTYTDNANLDSANPPASSAFSVSNHTVSGVSVNAAAKTVTLTLSSAVAYGESVTVSYTDPTASNDAKAIQDISGNDAASISLKPVTNNTMPAADHAPPVLLSAVVNGNKLVITFTDSSNLDAANPPSASAFNVSGNTVTGVSVNGAARTVTLTLSTPVASGESVTLLYIDPSVYNDGKAIQDLTGNDAATFVSKSVTNSSAPVYASFAATAFSDDGDDGGDDDDDDENDGDDGGNNNRDVKNGTGGKDTLNGSGGDFTMKGGKGNDTYIVDGAGDSVIENSGEGTDTVNSSVSYVLDANVENLTLTGTASISGTGNSLNNAITGNNGNNILDGDSGNDNLQGGRGNDIYIVDSSGDVVKESSNQGTDTVLSSATYSLASNIENLTLIGTQSINGTGNSSANTLIGNLGDNILVGGSGNDLISGGYGKDKLTGGSGKDVFIFNSEPGSENIDTITDFVHGTDKLQFSSSIFDGLAGFNGTLGSDQFYAAAGAISAHDSSDRLIYNSSSGALYYDQDGLGGAAALQVALLGTGSHPTLSASDIQVIS